MKIHYVFDSNALIKFNKMDIELHKIIVKEMEKLNSYIQQIVEEETYVNIEREVKVQMKLTMRSIMPV